MGVMDAWVAEFCLRRNRNPRVSPANLLLSLKLEACDVNVKLKISSVLQDISMCLARGKLDERILDLLETLDLLLLEENTILLESYKSAYCWMAVECTLKFMWTVPDCDSLFPDAFERIWTQRIGVLKERKSRLLTSQLLKWETDLRKALKEPELYERILKTNVRYTAATYLKKLIKDQWTLFGCSSLESITQRWFTKHKAERVRRLNAAGKVDNIGGSHAVDENIGEKEQEQGQEQELEQDQEQEQEQDQDQNQEQAQAQKQNQTQEQEQEQENEASVYKVDKMAAKELKDCLLEVQGTMDSSTGIGPSNASDQVLDATPPLSPRPGGDQDHNKTPDNVNDRGLEASQGTSSGRIRPYLPTPVSLKVSPLKKGNTTKPQLRRRKFWTPEEVDALREGVKEYGRAWKDIKNAYPIAFADRTEVDLKDKWRNMTS